MRTAGFVQDHRLRVSLDLCSSILARACEKADPIVSICCRRLERTPVFVLASDSIDMLKARYQLTMGHLHRIADFKFLGRCVRPPLLDVFPPLPGIETD